MFLCILFLHNYENEDIKNTLTRAYVSENVQNLENYKFISKLNRTDARIRGKIIVIDYLFIVHRTVNRSKSIVLC